MNVEDMNASQLMTRQLVTAQAHETLAVAGRRMNEHKIHCLLVVRPVDNGGLGIITIKDIVQVLGDSESVVLDELLVQDAMTSPVFTVMDDMRIPDCINLMRMAGIRRAPVMAGRELVGMLSFTDILRSFAGT